MRKRFSDKRMQAVFTECVESFNNKGSFLYWKGEPRRGSSGRCNFWNGYTGTGMVPDRGTIGYAYYAAGKECAK